MSNRLPKFQETPAVGRITLRNVAEALGMTTASVSRSLSGKGRESAGTRQRVQQKAAEMGYEVNVNAQQLRTQVSNTIAIFATSLDLGIATRKVELLQRHIIEHGYEAAIFSAGFARPGFGGSQQAVLASIRRQRPRALVCLSDGLDSDCARELERYQLHGGILITYGSPNGLSCDHMHFKSEINSYLAARHLVDLGHTKIGLFNHGHMAPHGARLEGFQKALGESGIATRDEWLLHGGMDDVYERCGAVLARQFLAMDNRPTGVCIVNDNSASSFIQQILRAGLRVPEDVSVVGTDNLLSAEYCIVPLTTVSHATDEAVDLITQMLFSRLQGEYDGPPRYRTLTGDLIVRDSTRRL